MTSSSVTSFGDMVCSPFRIDGRARTRSGQNSLSRRGGSRKMCAGRLNFINSGVNPLASDGFDRGPLDADALVESLDRVDRAPHGAGDLELLAALLAFALRVGLARLDQIGRAHV